MNVYSVLDPFISIPIIGLSGISLFIIAGTTPNFLFPQAIFFLVGIILMIIFSSLDFRLWSKLILLLYIGSLIFILMSFLSPEVRGTNRWVDLGILRLQPSEVIKPIFILVFAYLISTKSPLDLLSIVKQVALLLPIIFLIYKQPDLGNVLVYLSIFISLLIIGGIAGRYLLIAFLVLGLLFPFVWIILQDYQRSRIISYLNPQADPIGAGYNAIQSVIAIGSGRILGLGLGKGTQSRLLFLPEFHTDFIFASLGEELGFIGGSLIILFYFVLLAKILTIAFSSIDNYGKFLTIGVFTQFFIQVFINIGMNLGILPITGITLPLVSYGGSSIISTFIGLGLVISVARINKISPLVIR